MLLPHIRTGITIAYFVMLPFVLATAGALTSTRLLVILLVATLEAARRRFLPQPAMAVAVATVSCAAAVLDPVLVGLAPAAALALGSGNPSRAGAGILAAVAATTLPTAAQLHTAEGALQSPSGLGGIVLLTIGLGILEHILSRLEAAEAEKQRLQNCIIHLRNQSRQQQLTMQQAQHALTGRIELTERNRIARALHDALGHGLTGALWQLRAAEELLEHNDLAGARSSLQRGIAAVDGGLASIRSTVRDLRPREVPDLKAIQHLTDEFVYCPVELKFSGDPAQIPGGVLAVFCDNIRELLTNTMRHSGADRVHIDIARTAGFYRLEYRDNGIGLQASGQQRTALTGLGLESIRSRTEAISGRCSFGAASSSSTTGFVCVCLVQGDTQ